MKTRFWVGLILSLVLTLAFVVPGGAAPVGDTATQLLAPTSYKTEKGSASGAASAMAEKNQSGTADKPSAYVAFRTPGTIYRGVLTYRLPAGTAALNLTSLQLSVNFKGSPGIKTTWTWKLYNWNNGNWVSLGSYTTPKKESWNSFSFGATNVSRFFSNKGELRLQLASADASGDGKVDYAVVKVVGASVGNPSPTGTPIPAGPTATPNPAATATPLPTNAPQATSTPKPTVAPTVAANCASLNTAFEARLLELINQARADAGLPALRLQSQLTAAARGHSADMACNGYTGHTSPDGTTSKQRIEQQGYKWSWAGENIAWGFGSADQVFQLWMSDAPHKDNILGPNYTEVGVGYAYWNKSASGHYWTVDFARPK